MPSTIQPGALAVDVLLHLFALRLIIVILEGEGRTWDAKVCEGGERRVGAVVHDIEASNAMMIVVVHEELREIANLILVSDTEGYVFVIIGRGRPCFGIETVTEGTG